MKCSKEIRKIKRIDSHLRKTCICGHSVLKHKKISGKVWGEFGCEGTISANPTVRYGKIKFKRKPCYCQTFLSKYVYGGALVMNV